MGEARQPRPGACPGLPHKNKGPGRLAQALDIAGAEGRSGTADTGNFIPRRHLAKLPSSVPYIFGLPRPYSCSGDFRKPTVHLPVAGAAGPGFGQKMAAGVPEVLTNDPGRSPLGNPFGSPRSRRGHHTARHIPTDICSGRHHGTCPAGCDTANIRGSPSFRNGASHCKKRYKGCYRMAPHLRVPAGRTARQGPGVETATQPFQT